MSSILINDIFEELSEENRRLLNELMFANKYLNVLIKFKTFVDFISDKLKTNLDSNDLQMFGKLQKEVEEVIRQQKFKSISKIEIIEEKKSLNAFDIKKCVISSKKSLKSSLTNDISSEETLKENHDLNDVNEELTSDNKSCDHLISNQQNSKQYLSPKKEFTRSLCEYKGCNKDFSTRKIMREHYRTHFMKYSYTCDVEGCNYRTWRQRMLNQHKTIHNKDLIKPFKCKECNHSFYSKKSLKSHNSRVHNLRREPVFCDICGKPYLDQMLLNIHRKAIHMTKQFSCNELNCDFKASAEHKIRTHKIQKHSNERPFLCSFEGCSKTFKLKCNLGDHIRNCHKLEQTFSCTHEGCLKKYKTKNELTKHLYIHSEVKLKCVWPGCDYETPDPRYLRNHALSHNSNTFVCHWPQCNNSYKRKTDFELHLRIHNNEKPFVCNWPGCLYRTADSSNLYKHLKIHRK